VTLTCCACAECIGS